MQQYIIGYGSLLNSASKNRTYPNTSENIPIRVRGYNRIWNCKGVSSTLSTTFLGVKSSPDGSFNGAMFSLDSGSKGLRKFDERESFYCRKEVPKSNIEVDYSFELIKMYYIHLIGRIELNVAYVSDIGKECR
jgi:hypothetical protein